MSIIWIFRLRVKAQRPAINVYCDLSSIGAVAEVLSLIVFLQLTGTLILNVHGWSAGVCVPPSAANIGLLSCIDGYSSPYTSHFVYNLVVCLFNRFVLLCAGNG